jgi:RimJ/RimL family protein N-acetyltransferase
MFFAIVSPDGRAAGLAAYLRITPEHGTIEIGHIHYGIELQRTRAGTEATFLLMRHAFALGYRRYEWKCDSLNARSRAAAVRYGFTYEGTFRNALVTKGRNRDTAWFAITDEDWPAVSRNFEAWLDDSNFDATGRQRRSLRELASKS